MEIVKGYKVELDPNNKQRSFLEQCAGASRYVYNWGLAEWKHQYEEGGKPSAYSLRRFFNASKDEICPWIRDMPYAVIESAFGDLDTAFKNFFRRIKAGDGKPGYPRFKSKRRTKPSFALRNTAVRPDRVRLTRLGWVRLKERGYIPTSQHVSHGTYVTISRQASRWYISVQVAEEREEELAISPLVLGVDLGLKSRAVLSNGETLDAPKALNEHQAKRARLQREMARRARGSANWHKSVDKLRGVETTIANTRKHWLHQISHHVVCDLRPRVIVLENLNVSGMMANRHLSKAIGDAAFSELRRQIEYKARWAGVEVMFADRFFPSSKTCSECGAVKPVLKLSEREFACQVCGVVLDRDLNAALNLAALGV